MTGSLNWTNQGILGNYENVAILSHKRLVCQYAEKFEELWRDFADLRVPIHPIMDNKNLASNVKLKRSAWDNIIVNYEPPVNNCNSSGIRRPETRRF
jgi:phosphatidylserine/phosphatidylglycerophosphate/cardiolipin synthase-like enzyme